MSGRELQILWWVVVKHIWYQCQICNGDSDKQTLCNGHRRNRICRWSPHHTVMFCVKWEGVCCLWGAVSSLGIVQIVVQHMTHEVKSHTLCNRSMNHVCLHHTHCILKSLKLYSSTEDAHGWSAEASFFYLSDTHTINLTTRLENGGCPAFCLLDLIVVGVLLLSI